jgi:hypothetical protein
MTFSILALCFVLHIFVNITVNDLNQELQLSTRILKSFCLQGLLAIGPDTVM